MKNKVRYFLFLCILLLSLSGVLVAQEIRKTTTIPAGPGWANNAVNTVVFRKNSLCSFRNTQYISYYNAEGLVVLGKRKLSANSWKLVTTKLKGNVTDAHNSISMMTDGDGYLHVAWNHHGNALRYCKTVSPGSLELTEELSMTGSLEGNITYPEFYFLPDGNLLFFYRDGQSGRGNLVINHYNTKQKQWKQLHSNLIGGENKRNAYWQACVDTKGTVHISWVWRESPDVASNHDMCYARSTDGGVTWENSKGENYQLPIYAASAEYVCRIPEKAELINQTSMYADEEGIPFIASYWKDKTDSVPQYHIIYNTGSQWKVQDLGFRKTAFSLSGAGTKRIPVCRPQVISWKKGNTKAVALIFRDEERNSKVSIAVNKNITVNSWEIKDLTATTVGSWEPSYDTELWKGKKQLSLFIQFTDQKDSEGRSDIGPQTVKVLTIKIK